MGKKMICVDFDGVIHSYTSGWKGVHDCSDAPVAGAMEFLREASRELNVCIFSARNHYEEGIQAMVAYIFQHMADRYDELTAHDVVKRLKFPKTKPSPASLFIDDRAFQFNGVFPSIPYIQNFKPWQKRGYVPVNPDEKFARTLSALDQCPKTLNPSYMGCTKEGVHQCGPMTAHKCLLKFWREECDV